MTNIDEVRRASAAFYAALNKMAQGDDAAMQDAWTKGDGVTAQHPIGGRDMGSDTVLASFSKVAEIAGGGDIRLMDQSINAGSDMAVETGMEVGTLTLAGHEARIEQRVTNVYQRQGGVWKLAHHHTDLSPAMLEILERLTQAA
ncbi:YybH family protein [Aquicoccus sp. G2-2]|uniref:YybH family protein n=1 Tax=Aquicoccus sp. G2-2 TaxID=3092120 RepID=UPI002ADFECB7|nr:nuclear transport factor 2 family protein [Aquicoccus sp. G2-2]MEA1112680.1 nuclear transport factor 2 family protein [Aquicoccus sp. G2-2]